MTRAERITGYWKLAQLAKDLGSEARQHHPRGSAGRDHLEALASEARKRAQAIRATLGGAV